MKDYRITYNMVTGSEGINTVQQYNFRASSDFNALAFRDKLVKENGLNKKDTILEAIRLVD